MTAFVLSSGGTIHRDPPAELTNNAMTILKKRYLDDGSVDDLWDRVSGGNETYRNLLSSLRFLPNSPTLFNMGKNNGCTSSACFTFDVADSMFGPDSIVETREKAIAVAKAGGGVGYYFGDLRPKGSPIKSIHRVACGPVTVLKDYHAISSLITQGGKRELAQMGCLPCDHKDIFEFIHCKDEDPQGLGSFNISVSWYNNWISEVDWTSKPNDIAFTNEETEIWWEQCRSAWKHGCPGMFFPDIVNEANVNLHLGLVRCPNPCAEAMNRPNSACSLGSITLARYYNQGNRDINWNRLEEDVWNSTLFMDDILDRNTFPHPSIDKAVYLTRRLGLGVMGWADLLGMMHIHYDTPQALTLASKISKLINDVSHAASEKMGKDKGPYLGYDPVKTQHSMRRNETNTSVAPTGTIAIIAGVWGSIEPHLELQCERTTSEGIKLQDGVQDWCWNQFDGFVPKTASQISPEWHVRMQATWQANLDLGCSKTVNMPNNATIEDVSNTYKLMYDLKCKGGTIFRDGCRGEQVLVKKVKTKSVYQTDLQAELSTTKQEELSNRITEEIEKLTVGTLPTLNTSSPSTPLPSIKDTKKSTRKKPRRRCLPDEVPTIRVKIKLEGFKAYLHVGLYDDGTPGEIFFRASKNGSTINGWADSWAIAFSLALQYGVPLEILCNNFRGQRFEPAGYVGNKDVKICSSVVDFVSQWLHNRFVAKANVLKETEDAIDELMDEEDQQEVSPSTNGKRVIGSGQLCPDCDRELIWEGNCLRCLAAECGFSRCGG